MDFATRNQDILNKFNEAGRTQGMIQKLADEYGLTRQRVSAIIDRFDRQNNAGPSHEPYDALIGAWCANEELRTKFDEFCASRGWNRAAGMRKAIEALIANPEFEGKEDLAGPFDKPLGPWKTTTAQRRAFQSLLEAKNMRLAEGMRLAIQALMNQ